MKAASTVLGASLAFLHACPVAAGEHAHRTALGIAPTPITLPLPSGPLSLDLDDTTSVEVLGLTRAEADGVMASRQTPGLSAALLPAVAGDIFGLPPVSSNWETVRAAVAAGEFASRPTVGVAD